MDTATPQDHDLLGLVTVDPHSWQLLQQSVLDYVNEIDRKGFDLSVPSSTASCGCGKSFQI
jgi:iron-sulfur cluster assembly accessory protein